MSFTLEKVVPWGRSFDEYVQMFALSEHDLGKRLLGCGDGPANFNCILTRQGGQVISADPLYQFDAESISNRIAETYNEVMEQTRKNQDEFVWKNISSVEQLGQLRMAAMNEFLQDYRTGRNKGRYVAAGLPDLPFTDKAFDIALCSHFLFLYGEQLSEDFHVQSLIELCRAAHEVRVFPTLELGSRKSRYLDKVLARLKDKEIMVTFEQVPYEFQKGGNQMLKAVADGS